MSIYIDTNGHLNIFFFFFIEFKESYNTSARVYVSRSSSGCQSEPI